MMIKPDWWEYATYDDDGFVNGIREDAPENIKEAYSEYLKEKATLQEKGIKI